MARSRQLCRLAIYGGGMTLAGSMVWFLCFPAVEEGRLSIPHGFATLGFVYGGALWFTGRLNRIGALQSEQNARRRKAFAAGLSGEAPTGIMDELPLWPTASGFFVLRNENWSGYQDDDIAGLSYCERLTDTGLQGELIRQWLEIRLTESSAPTYFEESAAERDRISLALDRSPGEADVLAPFVDRLLNSLFERSWDRLSSGGEASGLTWSLTLESITRRDSTRERSIPLEEISIADWTDSEFCLWRTGQPTPIMSFRDDEDNVGILALLISRILGTRLQPGTSSDDAASRSFTSTEFEGTQPDVSIENAPTYDSRFADRPVSREHPSNHHSGLDIPVAGSQREANHEESPNEPVLDGYAAAAAEFGESSATRDGNFIADDAELGKCVCELTRHNQLYITIFAACLLAIYAFFVKDVDVDGRWLVMGGMIPVGLAVLLCEYVPGARDRLRYHEGGLLHYSGKSVREIRFEDLDGFDRSVTNVYTNGVYSNTTAKLTFYSRVVGQRKPLRFDTVYQKHSVGEEQVTQLVTKCSAIVADQMRMQLHTDGQVAWTSQLTITRNALEHRNYGELLTIPFSDIVDWNIHEGDLELTFGSPAQVITVLSTEPNVFAGMLLLGHLSKYAASSTADRRGVAPCS